MYSFPTDIKFIISLTPSFILSEAGDRSAGTWQLFMEERKEQGLWPEASISDAGTGLNAGIPKAFPNICIQPDIFHELRPVGAEPARLERKAEKLITDEAALEKRASGKRPQKKTLERLSQIHEKVDMAIQEYDLLRILFCWLVGQASPPRQNTNQKPANASQTWYQQPVKPQSLRQILANVNPSNARSAYSSGRRTGILNSKWLFWILTLVLALGISLAVFLFLSPIIFKQSDSEGIIESVINFMCMCSPYCIFAGGMFGTIYYNVQITLHTQSQILPQHYLFSVLCCIASNVFVGGVMFALTIMVTAAVGICIIFFGISILLAIFSGG